MDSPNAELYHAGERCRLALQYAEDACSPTLQAWLRHRSIEFKHWAACLGIFALGRNALDYRLRDHHSAQSMLVSLLDMLTTVVPRLMAVDRSGTATGHNTKVHSPERRSSDLSIESWSTDSSDADQERYDSGRSTSQMALPPDLADICRDVERLIHRLIDIGSIIRRSGAASRILRADDTFDAELHQPLRGHLQFMLRVSNMRSSFSTDTTQSSTRAIDLLPGIPLRAEQMALVHANLIRRHRFSFARKRAETLARPQASQPHCKLVAIGEHDALPSQGSATAVSRNLTINMPPTSVNQQQAPQFDVVSPSTQTSVTALDVSYPGPPRTSKDGAFKCPCCLQLQLKEVAATSRTWRSHLSKDLFPYACTADACAAKSTFFVKKTKWLQHIQEVHTQRSHWLCPLCHETRHFLIEKEFEQHIRQNHPQMFHNSNMADMVRVSEVKLLDIPLFCQVCSLAADLNKLDAYMNHVAGCMHSFSLNALPWNDAKERGPVLIPKNNDGTVMPWLMDVEDEMPNWQSPGNQGPPMQVPTIVSDQVQGLDGTSMPEEDYFQDAVEDSQATHSTRSGIASSSHSSSAPQAGTSSQAVSVDSTDGHGNFTRDRANDRFAVLTDGMPWTAPQHLSGVPTNAPAVENLHSWEGVAYSVPAVYDATHLGPDTTPQAGTSSHAISIDSTTGNGNFICEGAPEKPCGKRFLTKSAMSHHSRGHKPPRHFCSTCGSGCYYMKDLARHVKTHVPRHSNLVCPNDGCKYHTQPFSREDHLRRHEQSCRFSQQ